MVLKCYSGLYRIQTSSVQVGSNIGDQVAVFAKDRHANWCTGLPSGIDLTDSLPQLTVETPNKSSSQQTVRFAVSKSQDQQHVYGGRWIVKDDCLYMPDLAILGAPGTIQLTLSGGITVQGQPIIPHVQQLELSLGQIERISASGWLAGLFLTFTGAYTGTTA